jgi:MFS family permease
MTATDRGLWGHRDFLKLWGAQAISTFGARVAREGLPMAAVITLHAGPAAIGLFAALRLGSQGLMGLVAGPLADRMPKRSLLIAADLARVLVLAGVTVTALLGRLSLAEIYLAGVLLGAFSVIFDVADHAFLPALLKPSELVGGNSKLGATEAVAEVGGPALYGILFTFMAPAIAVVVPAATYLVSALLLGRIKTPGRIAPKDPDAAKERLDLAAGFKLVLTHPLVRPLWLADLTRVFFGGFFSALYIFFAVRWLHLTSWMFGLTVACGGVGALIGAVMAPRLTRTLGVGPTILITGAVGGAMIFLVPLAAGAPIVAMAFLCGAQLFGDGLQTVAEIGTVSLRQSVVPPEDLGRAGGAFASGAGFMGVAGALGGGWAGVALGPRETLYIAAAGITAASLFIALSPLWRVREAA